MDQQKICYDERHTPCFPLRPDSLIQHVRIFHQRLQHFPVMRGPKQHEYGDQRLQAVMKRWCGRGRRARPVSTVSVHFAIYSRYQSNGTDDAVVCVFVKTRVEEHLSRMSPINSVLWPQSLYTLQKQSPSAFVPARKHVRYGDCGEERIPEKDPCRNQTSFCMSRRQLSHSWNCTDYSDTYLQKIAGIGHVVNNRVVDTAHKIPRRESFPSAACGGMTP